MIGQTRARTKSNAIALRKQATDAERILWRHLRDGQLGVKFRRQHPFLGYVLDFVCIEKKLVVEVDGSQHLSSPKDAERDRTLKAAGFAVCRFWNNQVLSETDAVVSAIWQALHPIPTPAPPLEGEGGHWKDKSL